MKAVKPVWFLGVINAGAFGFKPFGFRPFGLKPLGLKPLACPAFPFKADLFGKFPCGELKPVVERSR